MKKILIILIVLCSLCSAQSHFHPSPIVAYGSIYYNDGVDTLTIPPGESCALVSLFKVNGESYNCIPECDSSRIKILITGKYRITTNFSTESGGAGVTLKTSIFVDENEVPDVHTLRRWSNANDSFPATMSCIVCIIKNQYVTIRCQHNSGQTIKFVGKYGNLNVEYIGG